MTAFLAFLSAFCFFLGGVLFLSVGGGFVLPGVLDLIAGAVMLLNGLNVLDRR